MVLFTELAGLQSVADLEADSRDHREKCRILVVDDQQANLQVANAMFIQLGHQVELAESGQESIDRCDVSFDVVFMDIEMPGMDGRQAMRAIKRKRPDQIVIALSANALGSDEQKYIDCGFDGYLSKPITLSKVRSCLAAIRSNRLGIAG